MSETNHDNVADFTVIHGRRKRARAKGRARRLKAKHKRTVGQFVASLGASFMPVASYSLAHSAGDNPVLWCLVVAALAYSLPSVATWAMTWTKSSVKSYGFAILLEGVLVFAPGDHGLATAILPYLGGVGLSMLVLINAVAAWGKAKGK